MFKSFILMILFTVTLMAGSVPTIPDNIREMDGTIDKNITIGWDDTADTDSYNIYYVTGTVADANLSYHLIDTVSGIEHMFRINEIPITSGPTPGAEPLKPYTKYRFSVSASNTFGESDKSAIISIRTLHTWHNELKACLNTLVHRDADYIADRQDVEGVTTFACTSLNVVETESVDELRDLIYVRDLNISSSNIWLSFPLWITEFDRLFSLKISGFKYAGTLADDFGTKLPNLLYLNLQENKLTDNIPSSLSSIVDLSYLNLSYNDFNGSIDASLAQLTQLKTLKVNDNNLSGDLPSELANLSLLVELSLGGNYFNSLPDWIGDITSLISFNVDNLSLHTHIPPFLKRLSSLEKLSMKNCNLQGSIPSWIDTLNTLKFLNLSQNKLFATIPSNIENMNALDILDLGHNCNLHSNDANVQDFVRWHCPDPISTTGCSLTSYEELIPSTNTYQCDMGMSPVRFYLLD